MNEKMWIVALRGLVEVVSEVFVTLAVMAIAGVAGLIAIYFAERFW